MVEQAFQKMEQLTERNVEPFDCQIPFSCISSFYPGMRVSTQQKTKMADEKPASFPYLMALVCYPLYLYLASPAFFAEFTMNTSRTCSQGSV